MKRVFLFLSLALFGHSAGFAQTVISLDVDGSINPVTASYIHNGIEKARRENAECVILHLNTPGGLLRSTRDIVSDILNSPVPVIVFVYPGGAQDASAGVFITLAAHVAAMAPGTNIGAAHPVTLQGSMDSVMGEKVTNDAAAFIRSIAAKRNRNLQWAENAVRRSYSYSENEALQDSVIDMIVKNDSELLDKIDGKNFEVSSGMRTLHSRNANIKVYRMGAIERFLNILSDPSIAYILMMLGLFGVLFELFNPGAILPGIVGVISLILAFYSMRSLPINYAGLSLIIFGIILFILEVKIVSHGLLAIGGIISLLLGSMMLIRSGSPWETARISRTIIISTTAIAALFFLFIVGAGIRSGRRKVVTGIDAMIGALGYSYDDLEPTGRVKVHGETWNAESVSGKISKGDKIVVRRVKDMKLFVEKSDS